MYVPQAYQPITRPDSYSLEAIKRKRLLNRPHYRNASNRTTAPRRYVQQPHRQMERRQRPQGDLRQPRRQLRRPQGDLRQPRRQPRSQIQRPRGHMQQPRERINAPMFTCMAQCTTAQTWTIGCGKSMSGTAVPAGSMCTRIATTTINPTQSIVSSLAGDEGYIVPYWRSIDDGKIHLCSRHYYYIRIFQPLIWAAVIAATVSAVVYRNEIQESAGRNYSQLREGAGNVYNRVHESGVSAYNQASESLNNWYQSLWSKKKDNKKEEKFQQRLDAEAELTASKEADKMIQDDPYVQAANAARDILSSESEIPYEQSAGALDSINKKKKGRQIRHDKKEAALKEKRGGRPRRRRLKKNKKLDGGSRSNRELYIRRSINKKRMNVYRL